MQLEHTFTVPVPVEVAWRALLDPEMVAPCFPGATLTGVTGDEFTGNVKVRMGPVSLLYKGTGRFASVDEAAHRLVLQATGKDSRGNGTASATVTATLAGAGESTAVDVLTELTITGRPAQLGRGLIAEVGGKIIDSFAGCLATHLGEPAAEPEASPAPATTRPASPNGPPAGAVSTPAHGATTTRAATSTTAAPSAQASTPASAATPVSASRSTSAPAATPGPTVTAARTPASRPRPVSSAEEIDLINLAGRPVLKRLAPVLGAVLVLLLAFRWWRRRR